MEKEAVKNYMYVNDKLVKIKNSNIFQHITDTLVYEVIRVEAGSPNFLNDHLERFFSSLNKYSLKLNTNKEDICFRINKLIEEDSILDNNIKIILTRVEGKLCLLIYPIKSFYPPEEFYLKGIKSILYNHERKNPNIKYSAVDFRRRVKLELEKHNAFEAILYNNSNEILEGSRSNIFFVKNKKLITAPDDRVLKGITRKYILKAGENLNLDVEFKNIKLDQLNEISGAFMSGTSVGILPITYIDNIKLNSVDNPTINSLRQEYIKIKSQFKES